MSNVNKIDRDDLTKKIFDGMWNGKLVRDAMERLKKRYVRLSKVLNCMSSSGCDWVKYEMDWRSVGLKVVLNGNVRPMFGIFEFFFGSVENKCYSRAVKWMDEACEEEQSLLYNVTFMAKDVPITGIERNQRLVEKFIKYIDSIEPEVTSEDANIIADKVLQED